jgi:benzoyl-CoA 2,3-dioxygenase component B
MARVWKRSRCRRHGYSKDCEIGLNRWNRQIKKMGIDFELTLPSDRFRRTVGPFANAHVSPDGKVISSEEWDKKVGDWLPTADDKAYIQSLMQQVVEPGKMAGWVAPPDRGINNNPVEYEYVRL